ncbi:sensor histidine kinase [Streptomyces sp. NPDC047061]|uniref:sensor histidine kinase n=1 Tax=Streptomyces sp. NPDC047061 TaxID=3154605 RepID=UPI0033D4FF70
MINSVQRILRNHPRSVDASLAAVLFACFFLGRNVTFPGDEPVTPWWPGVLLAAIASIALVLRRSRPRATVAVTMGCAVISTALGYVLSPFVLGPLMVALFSLAGRSNRRTANTFTFSCIILLLVTALISGPAHDPLVLRTISPAAWLLIPTALGTVARMRGDYLAAVQARAEHAERTREKEARHRVTEERMRIARELHDIVAHHLALANAQAGTVSHLIRTRPADAEKMVAGLADTTSSALRELKASVALLRHEDEAETLTAPAPGLNRLSDLLTSFQRTGLTVTLTVEGRPQPLSPGAELTAYRVVQEALTNVTKHASTSKAEVLLSYAHDLLRITVTNEAGAESSLPPVSGGGYGLIGMRERARSANGRLQAGRRPQGGFEVAIELPLCLNTPPA